MLFRHIILALLCWPCAMSEEAKKPEDIIDQIATASKHISSPLIIPETPEKSNVTSKNSSTFDDSTPVYYQNSNGFVPMINHDSSQSSTQIQVSPDTPTKWTNDAVFSAEARLLLALPNSRSDRRSFSVQDPQKDFEILKVNKETPAIANYHDFYENMQKNLRTSSRTNRYINNTSPIRTRDRIKMIDEYFNKNLDHRKSNYPHNFHPQEDVLQKPSIFEPEKVHNNYPQYGVSNNQAFSYIPPSPQKISNPGRIHFESHQDSSTRNHQNSKPVVIPEITDYRDDQKYDYQQTAVDVSTRSTHVSQKYERDESEDRYDRKEDYSDSSDYLEITERPKRVHKSRRRPSNSETSRKQPMEHRDRDADDSKKTNSGRTKSRGRVKTTYWSDDRDQSPEDLPVEHKKYPEPSNTADNQNQNLLNEPNVWSQVAPNVELSQSNGYEINQMDNTKLLFPVNLNLVPISNFNHVNNAGVSSMITPLVSSTASPLLSTSSSMIKLPQNSLKNYGYPTGIPDVIVGQNGFQSPVQVLLPQMNMQNKYPQNVKTQYLASTVAPMFTISQQFTPSAHGIQSTQSPKLTSPGNQYGPQMFLPQSTVHTFLQTPTNSGNYNIFVNSRGAPRGQEGQQQANSNALKYGSQSSDKHNQYHGSNAHILTSASFSVSQDGNTRENSNTNNNEHDDDRHKDHNTREKYQQASTNYHSSNPSRPEIQENSYQVIRGAQVVPAIIHANGIPGVDLNHGHIHQAQSMSQPTYVTQNGWRQLQHFQVHDPNKNNRYQNVYGVDSLGSTSNNNANIRNGYMEQAQLPVVGMQTVEIRNPNINIKPSPVDLTMVNPLEAVHYPAVLTTPIPILTTTAGFLTPRPILTSTPETISIQSYVDSLTQIGSQQHQANQQSSIFNPMNFIPNYDLLKSQTMLNNKVHIPKPLPQHLNLVPIVPGGNFDKHSPTAQVDLITKPKLSSDLEKYAEEMFKESLRTIYNTHKWNSDKRVRNLTDSDIAELERLKSDLSRFKAAMSGNYGRDIEAHHSETKFRAVEPGQGSKHSGLSAAAIEQLFKSDFKLNGNSENSYSSQDGKGNRGREEIRISDYLTPPKLSGHGSKGNHFEGSKKRPGKGGRYEGKARPHSKGNSRPSSPDTASSNHVAYSHRRPPQKGYKKTPRFDDYPTFTTSAPNEFKVFSDNDKSYRKDYYDINHPRTHNLLGLLMKNKQLPSRDNSNYFYDDQEDLRRRPEELFYDDIGNFRKKSDSFTDSSRILQPPKLGSSHKQ